MKMTSEEKAHLYARSSFFVFAQEWNKSDDRKKVVEAIVKDQKFDPLNYDLPKLDPDVFKKGSKSKRQALRKTWRQQALEINAIWIRKMITTKYAFQERMTLFWTGHFACRTIDNPYFTLDLNNKLRKHALGNFRDLLVEVAKSPAMINYLHLKQNKKGKPNEDFARELCELFTLGRDVDYTEKDVMEIARAFTGRTYNFNGEHVVNPRQHDDGEKTIFGKTGRYTGEDVLDMILENPHTADFIAKKVYLEFVQQELNDQHVRELSNVLFQSNYSIKTMMTYLFEADWFYEAKAKRLKSPIELLVGLGRMFELEFQDAKSLFRIQKVLGQVLFDPPNVAGWPGGRSWIDASRLAFRLRLGALITNKGVVEVELTPELDEMLSQKTKKQKALQLFEEVDWEKFFRKQKTLTAPEMVLQTIESDQHHLSEELKADNIIQLLSTPDFQLI